MAIFRKYKRVFRLCLYVHNQLVADAGIGVFLSNDSIEICGPLLSMAEFLPG